ncbi:predicted protein [Lichtheimia corymbifera JMRC:FSU:9682]|nr:predicted protein [Lichtheimia corymbifera JMRC:FSU:9682]
MQTCEDHVNIQEDQEGDDNDDEDDDWEKDPTFHRMYQLTESMIQMGQESLRFQYKGARVLSHYNQDDEEDEEEQVEDNNCEPAPQAPTTDQSTKWSPAA